jgi:hypothetical protein
MDTFMNVVGYQKNNIPVPASLEFAASLDQSSGDLAV